MDFSFFSASSDLHLLILLSQKKYVNLVSIVIEMAMAKAIEIVFKWDWILKAQLFKPKMAKVTKSRNAETQNKKYKENKKIPDKLLC